MMDTHSPGSKYRKALSHPPRNAATDANFQSLTCFRHELTPLNKTMTVEDAFRVTARNCLDDLIRYQDATSAGDPDALHQMRIAHMRLRTTVSFFSPMTADIEWHHLKRGLKWLNRRLGAARDLDVILKRLTGRNGQPRDALLNDRKLERKWIKSHKRLAKALQSKRYRQLIKEIATWIENGRWSRQEDDRSKARRITLVPIYSARKLAQWHKGLLRRCRRYTSMGPTRRHHLRIRTKRFRYAIELFGELPTVLSAANRRTMLNFLREAHDSLGSLNDTEVAKSLSASFKYSTQKAIARSKKHEKRLTKRVKSAFQNIAGLNLL